jgi:hypothetical protein
MADETLKYYCSMGKKKYILNTSTRCQKHQEINKVTASNAAHNCTMTAKSVKKYVLKHAVTGRPCPMVPGTIA